MKKYNGHPSYEHWNVALWICNDESLCKLANELHGWGEYGAEELIEAYPETGDGVKLTVPLALHAMACASGTYE